MEQAKLWFEQSALQALPKAQHALGVMYRKMRLPERAKLWLQRAAEQGDLIARYELGMMFMEEESYQIGTDYLCMAAREGDLEAIAALSAAPKVLPIPCFSCGEYLDKSVIKMCACGGAYYCSRSCQVAEWNMDHKSVCKKIRANKQAGKMEKKKKKKKKKKTKKKKN